MEEKCNKENECDSELTKSVKTPVKDRVRSPGPKVAKLLEVFSGVNNHGGEQTPIRTSESKCDAAIRGFRSKEDKLKSARAARLNASYVEANKVINQLLETTVGEKEINDTLNQSKTPQKNGSNNNESTTKSDDTTEGVFDVQKFLDKYCSKASPVVKEAPVASEEVSPKPTAALAYLHLVSQRSERSSEKRFPKIGVKLQHLMSNFENTDELRSPGNCQVSVSNNQSQPTSTSDTPVGESQKLQQINTSNSCNIRGSEEVKVSTFEDSTEDDSHDHPGSSKKRKLDATSNSDCKTNGVQFCASEISDDGDQLPQKMEDSDSPDKNEPVLMSSFCEKMKEWVDDDDNASEFQKLLLRQAAALRKQKEMPVENAAFTFGKVIESPADETESVECGPHSSTNDLYNCDSEADAPLRSKKCVEFNSSIDFKSETSDSFSNYSTGVEDTNLDTKRPLESIYSEVDVPLKRESMTGVRSSPLKPQMSSSSIESQSAQSTSSSEYMSLPKKISCDGFTARDEVYISADSRGLSSARFPIASVSESDCTLQSNEYEVSDVDCSLVSSTCSSAEQNAAIASVLMDEIIIQQNIIQQVSRALNIAESRNPLKNSMEQIEAERVLLAANARQNALKQELSILHNPKLFQTDSSTGDNSLTSEQKELACFGNVTVSNITMPLRRDELFHLQLIGQNIYYVCLVKYRTQVVATQIVAASCNQSTTLTFSNLITFRNVDPSFNIVLEIWSYTCSTQKQGSSKGTMYSGDSVKYQATEKRKASFLTSPFVKKSKTAHDSHGHSGHHKDSGNSSNMPSPCSVPGYRKVGFAKVASLVLTRKNCSKESYNLQQVTTIRDGSFNPLKGTMSVTCELFPFFQMEYKGFLNMEDDKGKAIWRMRWCKLSNTKLTFWKFAENEHSIAPIGYIDLRLCEDIVEVSRLECAIPYAFALLLRPSPSSQDSQKSSKVFSRQLLCTDSKESRTDWMRNIKLVLVNLKTWTTD